MSGIRIFNVEPEGYSPKAREVLGTLGEVTVIFTAAVGVLILLGHGRGRRSRKKLRPVEKGARQ